MQQVPEPNKQHLQQLLPQDEQQEQHLLQKDQPVEQVGRAIVEPQGLPGNALTESQRWPSQGSTTLQGAGGSLDTNAAAAADRYQNWNTYGPFTTDKPSHMQHDAVSNNLHAEPASSAIFNSTYGYTAVKFASDQDSCNDTSQSHSVSDRQDGVESGPGSADVSCHLHKSVDDTVVSCAALLPGSVHGDDSMPVESAAESDHEDVSHDSASNYLDAQAVVIQRGQSAVRSNSLVQSLQQAAGHHPLGLRQPIQL